jgi:hypothetical protein
MPKNSKTKLRLQEQKRKIMTKLFSKQLQKQKSEPRLYSSSKLSVHVKIHIDYYQIFLKKNATI